MAWPSWHILLSCLNFDLYNKIESGELHHHILSESISFHVSIKVTLTFKILFSFFENAVEFCIIRKPHLHN